MSSDERPDEPAPAKRVAAADPELAELHETIRSLRQQLAKAMERLDTLEKKE